MQTASSFPPCQVGWFINIAERIAIPAACKRWECRYCGPRRVRRERIRMERADYTRLITLTMRPEDGICSRLTLRKQSRSWARLRRFLAKRYALSSYTWVRELSSSGRLHLHVAVNSRYVPQRVLSRACARAG